MIQFNPTLNVITKMYVFIFLNILSADPLFGQIAARH